MAQFTGFAGDSRLVPVPSPLFGQLLEAITDIRELKCTLRFFWHLSQAKGQPRLVRAGALLQDESLLAALGSEQAVGQGVRLALERGTLLAVTAPWGEPAYALHTSENRKLAAARAIMSPAAGLETRPPPSQQANIFTLYEENIGVLTPLLAEELRDAEAVYPWPWIQEAFREAVENNRRSWRYISRILEHWNTRGRTHGTYGEPGRDPQALTAAEYLRKYGLPGAGSSHRD